jgi:hypothetical protein
MEIYFTQLTFQLELYCNLTENPIQCIKLYGFKLQTSEEKKIEKSKENTHVGTLDV